MTSRQDTEPLHGPEETPPSVVVVYGQSVELRPSSPNSGTENYSVRRTLLPV